MRREKTVNIDGVDYQVKECSVRQMMPIMPRLAEEESSREAQLELVASSVSCGGVAIDPNELGISVYMRLAKEVLEVNGMGKAES